MLIDGIDFALLYKEQLRQAKRTEKSPQHWDRRASKITESCGRSASRYLRELLSHMDLTGAPTLLEDIQGSDLTTRALGIGFYHGRMQFIYRTGGRHNLTDAGNFCANRRRTNDYFSALCGFSSRYRRNNGACAMN